VPAAPALEDGVPVDTLHYDAPAAIPAPAAPAAFADAVSARALADAVPPALARAALSTLGAAAAAAASPGCFAVVYCAGYYGNICFRSSVPVTVDSA